VDGGRTEEGGIGVDASRGLDWGLLIEEELCLAGGGRSRDGVG
jgi:hypothetical protein